MRDFSVQQMYHQIGGGLYFSQHILARVGNHRHRPEPEQAQQQGGDNQIEFQL